MYGKVGVWAWIGLDCGLAMCTRDFLSLIGSFFIWMRMRGQVR